MLKILFCGKWPPIQGGVCRESYEFVLSALADGAHVTVVTNANAVETNFRMTLFHPEDQSWLHLHQFHDRFKLINVPAVAPTSHIPGATPFLSSCLGAVDLVVRREQPDAIVGSYFEPYGLAAALVGRIHSLPTFVRHAGSDLGRLAAVAELQNAYRLAFTSNRLLKLLTYDSPRTNELLQQLGIANEQMIFLNPRSFDIPRYHHDGLMDVSQVLTKASGWLANLGLPGELLNSVLELNGKPFAATAPIIGIFGKSGTQKGTYDLARALAQLAVDGVEFSFLPMCSGQVGALAELYRIITECPSLAERTHILPPVALWHVPTYIRLCSLIAFLENRFSVDFHSPGVPWQVIAEGIPFLLSGEQFTRIEVQAQLVRNRNCLVVDDPRQPDQLQSTLRTGLERLGSLTHGASNLRKVFSARDRLLRRDAHHPMYAAVKAELARTTTCAA